VGTTPEICRIHFEAPGAQATVSEALWRLLGPLWEPGLPLVCLCIGTDRSTGDALGPLVGRALRAQATAGVHVVGCLDDPVHATNLAETLARVEAQLPGALVVAVDACLGRVDTVGTITIGRGPLLPGAGVNKALPSVGTAFVTGTVNVGGFMEYFVLQNTRLSLVLRMAEVIAGGLAQAFARLAVGEPRPAAVAEVSATAAG
jgi:putative sporulation protein YyaC